MLFLGKELIKKCTVALNFATVHFLFKDCFKVKLADA
jgi:hypothetical protein